MRTDTGGGRKRILLGFTSVPFPLRADGLSVRYLPILQYLGQRHEVDVIATAGSPEAARRLEGLRPYCRKVLTLEDPRRLRARTWMKAQTYAHYLLPWGPPISVVSHAGSAVTREIVDRTAGSRYDAVVWVGGDLLPHLLSALPAMSVDKVFVDFIDSPYLWAQRRNDGIFRRRWFSRYERWKTARWERRVIREVDGAIFISEVDARAVSSGDAPMQKRYVVPNGINLPSGGNGDTVSLPTPNVGFLGNMGYPPNIEAVEWLYQEVYEPLRGLRPELNLVVIGRNPSASVRTLGKQPGVTITGEVDDIWSYIRSIDLFLFPLLRGAGLKNKILEAMFAGRPVVTTAVGNEGIDATDGEEVALCRTAEDFRRTAIRLLDSPGERRRMGEAGHAFVRSNFAWGPLLSKFEGILLEGTVRPHAGNAGDRARQDLRGTPD
jgi:glycosyltransferase involved in cell wall biosynthesis